MKISIGIDPGGSSGGIAIIKVFDDGKEEVHLQAFNKLTEQELMQWIKFLIVPSIRKGEVSQSNIHCVIEKVHSMPAQGISSAFSFGENYGLIRGIIMSMYISFDFVTPQSWMKAFGMKKNKTESQTEWKKRLRQLAQSKYPNEKVTANTADALLIAHFCKISNL